MNLIELKEYVDNAIEHALECEESPKEVIVSLQIDSLEGHSIYAAEDIELHYDNNLQASGCVLVGVSTSNEIRQKAIADTKAACVKAAESAMIPLVHQDDGWVGTDRSRLIWAIKHVEVE